MEGVVVSTAEASAVAGSTVAVLVVAGSTREALPVAVSTALVVSVVDISPVAFVAAVLVGGTGVATGAITDSLMMSSSAATAFRGAGTIHTDIMVTTITRTITMDTAGPVTTVAAVTDTAIAADQGIPGVSGDGDKPVRRFEIARLLVRTR
jgi:hypothetical protein